MRVALVDFVRLVVLPKHRERDVLDVRVVLRYGNVDLGVHGAERLEDAEVGLKLRRLRLQAGPVHSPPQLHLVPHDLPHQHCLVRLAQVLRPPREHGDGGGEHDGQDEQRDQQLGKGEAARRLALLRRARGDGFDRALDAPLLRLRLLGLFDRLGVFALMGEAQLLPSLPCRRGGLERLGQIGGRLDLARFLVQRERHLQRLRPLHAGRLAVAGPQRDEDVAAHGCDGAAEGVAVDGDLHRRANFPEQLRRIERDGNRRHGSVAQQLRPKRL